jgi:hypothetical protein
MRANTSRTSADAEFYADHLSKLLDAGDLWARRRVVSCTVVDGDTRISFIARQETDELTELIREKERAKEGASPLSDMLDAERLVIGIVELPAGGDGSAQQGSRARKRPQALVESMVGAEADAAWLAPDASGYPAVEHALFASLKAEYPELADGTLVFRAWLSLDRRFVGVRVRVDCRARPGRRAPAVLPGA